MGWYLDMGPTASAWQKPDYIREGVSDKHARGVAAAVGMFRRGLLLKVISACVCRRVSEWRPAGA